MPDREDEEIKNRVRYSLIQGENDVATLCPDLVEDWDYKLNSILPDDTTITSRRRIHWICHVCGHRWVSRLDSRTVSNHGCPRCSRGFGSSIPDLLLYSILKESLGSNCEVFYRYNVLPGCEADSYILDKKIAIEYNGYTFHSTEYKKKKDIEKAIKFNENGIKLIVFKERGDRDLYYEIQGSDVYVPEFSKENFSFLKETIISVLLHFNIINHINESINSICLEDFKYSVNKPVYNKSLIHILDKRSDIVLDEKYIDPADVFASSSDILNFKCVYGHKFSMRVGHVSEGYGCPYCSGHRNEEYESWEKAYNLYLLFEKVRISGKSSLNLITGTIDFQCPYCGKHIDKKLPTASRGVVSKFCDCTELISDVNIYILGEDYDSRIFYVIEVLDIFYFVVADNIEDDYILNKVKDSVYEILDYIPFLDLDLFKKYMGIPSIYKSTYNSYNTVPINKTSIQNYNLVTDFEIESIYKKLVYQRINGIYKNAYGSENIIKLTKNIIISYLKERLSSFYGMNFAVNQTIGSFNTDLSNRYYGVSILVKLNLCNKKHYHNITNLLNVTGEYIPIVLTSYSEFSWSDRVIVTPTSVRESELDYTLNNIFIKVVNKLNEDIDKEIDDF